MWFNLEIRINGAWTVIQDCLTERAAFAMFEAVTATGEVARVSAMR